MKFTIKTTGEKFNKILTEAISRRGFTVYTKSDGGYGVQELKDQDVEMLKNMVAQLCDHNGVKYEIKC